MRTAGLTRIFPGNVQAAFADATSDGVRSAVVVVATPDVSSLTWRQTLITRKARSTLQPRRARATVMSIAPRQRVVF